MLRTIGMLFLIAVFGNCQKNVPLDITYKKGDFWVSDFRNNSFPGKAFADDKIYCSGLRTDSSNLFYCLNLTTGKVDWVTPVTSWAAQPPVIARDLIYYCGYLGDIYKLDKHGNEIWKTQLNGSYGGHRIDPVNNDLLVDVVMEGYARISFATGAQTIQIGSTQVQAPVPVLSHDTAYQLVNDSLFCRKSTTGSGIWKIQCDARYEGVFLIKGSVYYYDNMNYLHALDSRTGAQRWRSDTAFPRQEVNPHVELEQGKLLCFFSNLDDARIINIETGKQERTLTYQELQDYLKPLKQYMVSDGRHDYQVTVKNAFGGGQGSFRDTFDVIVEERN